MVLPSTWELPETIKRRFGQRGAGKQRAMVHEGHLLLVLHELPHQYEPHREAVFYWREPNGEWHYSGRGNGMPSLMELMQTYEKAEQDLKKEYEQAEDSEDYFRILEKLSPLQHAAKNLHTTLQVAREGIHEDRDIIDLRDWAYNIERGLDLLYRDAKNALDFSIARKG